MAIPASQIVKINPRILQPSGTDLALNGMFLTTSPLIPAGSAMGFSTKEDVLDFFGANSTEYKVAAVYFNGYQNSFKKPRQIFYGSRIKSAVGAWLRGAKYTGTIDKLKAVTSGTLTLSIDGTSVTATSISLSSATSYSDVATAIQTKIAAVVTGATCTYSALTGAFQINSPTTGTSSTITYATYGTDTDLASLLGLTEKAGAVLSQGSAAYTDSAEDIAANMMLIRGATENWATFTHLYSADNDEMLALSKWASDQGVEYLYVCWSTAGNLKQQEENTSIASALKDADAGATTLIFGDATYAAFIMGEAASIDWDRTQGTINFAFKSQDGLVPTIDNATEAQTLLDKTCNLYGAYATRNDDFVFLYNGCMFGAYRFIDNFINAIWFNNALQLALLNGLHMAPRVPYNDDGYTLIRAWCMDPINRAKKNGVIDPNVVLTEAQKTEIMREAGMDISANLETDGYYLQVVDAGAHVRQTRDTPNCSLWYAYGGSVNRIELASTLLT